MLTLQEADTAAAHVAKTKPEERQSHIRCQCFEDERDRGLRRSRERPQLKSRGQWRAQFRGKGQTRRIKGIVRDNCVTVSALCGKLIIQRRWREGVEILRSARACKAKFEQNADARAAPLGRATVLSGAARQRHHSGRHHGRYLECGCTPTCAVPVRTRRNERSAC